MKPIHKFNNGNGATLCNKCRAIITEGLTDDLICRNCQPVRITLTRLELNVLAHLTRHFVDYTCGDDRPDHGLGILKQYRDRRKSLPWNHEDPTLLSLSSAMGKLNRRNRKLK